MSRMDHERDEQAVPVVGHQRSEIAEPKPAPAALSLFEAKTIADDPTTYSIEQLRAARTRINRTSSAQKTRRAWDRLDRRLERLDAAIAKATGAQS